VFINPARDVDEHFVISRARLPRLLLCRERAAGKQRGLLQEWGLREMVSSVLRVSLRLLSKICRSHPPGTRMSGEAREESWPAKREGKTPAFLREVRKPSDR
jgi:hypothetical protein